MKTIDLFAGIGGVRIGFEKAGFKTVFASDLDAYCKITYDKNFKETPLFIEDIFKLDEKSLPDFNLLLGGFPCQPFSIAGYRKGFSDKGRGDVFFEIVRILDRRRPEAFFLENVKNLKAHDNGRTYKIIYDTLSSLGYSIKSEVLNSMEYGNVPQNRERIYMVGFLSKAKAEKFVFPGKIKLTKNIAEILEPKVDGKYYYNNTPLYKKLKASVKSRDTVYQWRRIYVRENKAGVCPTLTANMGTGGHNVPIVKDNLGIRKLTPVECLRLQGFPNSYKLPEELADSRLYKQIGNSVTASVIGRIANGIMETLN